MCMKSALNSTRVIEMEWGTEWHLPKTLPVVGDTATLGNKLVPQQ